MPTITASITIGCDQQEVYALFMPERLGDWFGRADDTSFHCPNPSKFGLSSVLELHSSRETLVLEITQYTPPTLFAWRSTGGRAHSLAFRLKAGDGGTLVEASETYAPRNLMGRILDSLVVRPMMHEALRFNLIDLKDLAEGSLPDAEEAV